MTGAIEFLRKAKLICEDRPTCYKCPISDLCGGMSDIIDEAETVSKVMAYRIKESEA
jgi:hypothetical protein